MATYYLLDGSEYKEVSLDDLLKAEKLVKEADLLTIKGSSETKAKTLEAEIASLKENNEKLLGRSISAESASEEVKKQLDNLKPIAEKVPTLETELNALKEKHSAAETQLLTTKRNSIIEKYQLKDEAKAKIESMSAEQLASAEEAFSLIGSPPSNKSPQNYDRNPNRSRQQDWDESSGLQDIKEGMSEIRTVGASAANEN